MMKLRDVMGFLGASSAALVVLLLVTLRVTGCTPLQADGPGAAPLAGAQLPPVNQPPSEPQPVSAQCRVEGWQDAAQANADSLVYLQWAPFRRPEVGWEVYAPLIQKEVGTACPANSEGFAAAVAAWQRAQRMAPDGLISEPVFLSMKSVVQTRREFVRATADGACPETSNLIAQARLDEGYSGKTVWLRPTALAAYRRMVQAARAEVPEIAADPRNLTIFSGYRSPSADAARCLAEGNCDGIVRARCSAHRTGLAADIYVGQAPGFGPDSSADPNRLFMTRTATYRWLLANAGRFGFVNYPFEPWHWEWTGEAP